MTRRRLWHRRVGASPFSVARSLQLSASNSQKKKTSAISWSGTYNLFESMTAPPHTQKTMFGHRASFSGWAPKTLQTVFRACYAGSVPMPAHPIFAVCFGPCAFKTQSQRTWTCWLHVLLLVGHYSLYTRLTGVHLSAMRSGPNVCTYRFRLTQNRKNEFRAHPSVCTP